MGFEDWLLTLDSQGLLFLESHESLCILAIPEYLKERPGCLDSLFC